MIQAYIYPAIGALIISLLAVFTIEVVEFIISIKK